MIIRLIDPPLHEFLPSEEELLEEVITMRVKEQTDGLQEKEELLHAVQSMHESNPMMGLRGVMRRATSRKRPGRRMHSIYMPMTLVSASSAMYSSTSTRSMLASLPTLTALSRRTPRSFKGGSSPRTPQS